MAFAKRLAVIACVLVGCVACDQATKSIATSILPETAPWSFLGDTIRLQVIYNQGAFLSLGAALPQVWRQAAFIVGAGGLLVGALVYALFNKPGRPPVVLAVALICAGGTGNLWDRVTREGRVVDFINIGIGSVRTGIFNFADLAIIMGLLLFVVHAWPRRLRTP